MDYNTFASFGETLKTFRQRKNITQQELASRLDMHRNTISGWERGDYLPKSRGMVLELAKCLSLDDQETRCLLEASLTAQTPYWNLPILRNPFFTGREEVLEALHERLRTDRMVDRLQSCALYGMGGIGKTQVAIEYAHRYALEYRAVFWLAAETIESLMASLQQVANLLQLSESQAEEQSQVVAAVQRWLATHPGWLLIGDNVEDLDLLLTVLPSLCQGALLVTTHRQALGILAEPLALPPLSNEEGITLLLRRARRMNTSDLTTPAAIELVKLLEGLPLALDQAGAYIEETGCSVTEYLRRCRDQRKHVLARRGSHGGAHPASVTATLMLSVEQVERGHPAAAELLRACAFLHPEAIPEELLLAEAFHPNSLPGSAMADSYYFDMMLATLRNASLLMRHPETRTLSVHRLVQAVLQDQMEPAEARLWSERVVRMVNAIFPDPEFDNLAQCERSLAQALACKPLIERLEGDLPEASELLAKTGSYLLWRGRLDEGEPLLKQAVALVERHHGTDHPALILYLTKQAELTWTQGKYEYTGLLLQRALTLAERHRGADHLQTARILNALGILYWKQGKYEQAEPLYQRALCIREQQLGSEHLTTAETLNDLALLYREQRRLEEAEPLYQRSLHIREQQLGFEHAITAVSINNLANLYCDLGKREEAEPLYQRSLRIREQQFGPEHSKTAIVLINLATLYRDQGKYDQAEPLYQRALAINERQLGPDHPEMATVLHHLGRLYHQQEHMERAEPLYQRALAIAEQRLGSLHPKTVKIRDDYNRLLEQRKSIPQALNGKGTV